MKISSFITAYLKNRPIIPKHPPWGGSTRQTSNPQIIALYLFILHRKTLLAILFQHGTL